LNTLKRNKLNKRVKLSGNFSEKKTIPNGSKYKNVTALLIKGKLYFRASIRKYNNWEAYFEEERDAAKAVDIKRLEKGDKAVNILIPVKNV